MNRSQFLTSFFIGLISSHVSAASLDVYLINKDPSQNIGYQLFGDSASLSLPGSMVDMTLPGLCLKEGECTRVYDLEDGYNKVYGRMNGLTEVPKESRIKTGSFPVIVTNEVERAGDEIRVRSESAILGSKSVKNYVLNDLKLKIDIADKPQKPRRFGFEEVSPFMQDLAPGVFQIALPIEDEGLSGSSSSSGTGFFISGDGYVLTNLHVAGELKECMKERSCEVEIYFKDSESRKEEVLADVLTCSKQLDFCLLKIDNIPVQKHFTLETNEIGQNLITLGFPGDKKKTYPGSENEEIPLTYAFGSPIGFYGLGVSSSLYIAGGASGSPVLMEDGERAVGILSNGAQAFGSPDGSPGIFRPMAMIERVYNISEYLDERKQGRVDGLIDSLNTTENLAVAKDVLAKFSAEKSYYGLNQLEILSYAHPTKAIRKELFHFLKDFKTDF